MIRILSVVVFLVLQIAFLPFAIVGMVLLLYRQMVISKRLGVSQTGIEVLNARWTMHVFDIRRDRPTAALAAVLPNTSLLGMWLFLIPLWVAHKIRGTPFLYPRVPEEGAEDMRDLVVARTLYFDRILERVVGDVEQFVVLGAGYDTRAYGRLKKRGLVWFELDQAATQNLKVSGLHHAEIDTAHVSFVAVDFARDDAFERLRASGYDPAKKTVFLWEGVTLYLSEEDVRKTLRDIRHHSAPGSVVVADLYAERLVRIGKGFFGKKTLEFTGEGFGFGLPFESDHEATLRTFLESEGMKPGETFFMGRTSKKGPFMVVTEFGV